ncbi:hemerythrin domain-containing protein [Nocardioides mangrovicus]|uniref:Hemerythrin domain-containing protein n=1 Tax=Nocardioides mangrovicus TaxID=2478913 RepID=A0A3L8NZV5_9ACTN|nr:hemerythrin domain-containing protein [Nocardioides mangrovicus]RLV48197.1 hemerythrin domain-containing protein [Nocardioides mangrovicus]
MVDIIELIYEDHVWFRRYFFYLDAARTDEERAAIWEPLASRLDAHAQAEEEIFYPALLQEAEHGDPEEETDDAIGDHNDIRDAVRASRSASVGSEEWWKAVTKAREANGEHLEEEEREGMTGVIRDVSLEERHDMGMRWLQFYAVHWGGAGVDDSDKDPEEYIAENS